MSAFRYIVHDVDGAIDFYCRFLGFTLDKQFGAAMAIVRHGDLSLWLAGPAASAARPMPDGRVPEPGGWSRIVIEVDQLDALIERLRHGAARFRNDIVTGPGGRQILVEDPSGNAVELFEPG
jgi:catechol 2,3-dioxygenase-like lactoylglutathione lyase family enzyme